MLSADFMRNAFIGGTLVAIAAGLIGYFVVIRHDAFAAHALAHIGFPGATPPSSSASRSRSVSPCSVWPAASPSAPSASGSSNREIVDRHDPGLRHRARRAVRSLASKNTSTVTNVLFGNLLAISADQIRTFTIFTIGLAVVLAVVARPLLFASVDPQVAEAKGVPVRALGIVFMVLLALVITMAVQVVGTLLLFALVVTPARHRARDHRPAAAVVALGTGIGLAAVWLGLVLAVMFNLPPSFCIVTLAFLVWIVTLVATRDRRRVMHGSEPAGTHRAGVDRHHAEPAELSL